MFLSDFQNFTSIENLIKRSLTIDVPQFSIMHSSFMEIQNKDNYRQYK